MRVVSPTLHKPPGIIMRQSGKPRPASPSEITTACLQDELANDGGGVNLTSGIMARRCQTELEITDNFFFCRDVPPAPLYYDYNTVSTERESDFLCLKTPFIPGRVHVAVSVIASGKVSGLYIPISPPGPQLFLMPSAQEPIERVIRRTRLLGPTIQSHHGRVRERGSEDTPFPRSLTPHTQFKPNTSSLIRTPVNLRDQHGRRSDDQKSTDFPPRR